MTRDNLIGIIEGWSDKVMTSLTLKPRTEWQKQLQLAWQALLADAALGRMLRQLGPRGWGIISAHASPEKEEWFVMDEHNNDLWWGNTPEDTLEKALKERGDD